MKISEKIFKIMDEKGITQLELSKATGIAQSVISDWKTKGTNPSANKLLSIAKALDCDVMDLLTVNGKRWCK